MAKVIDNNDVSQLLLWPTVLYNNSDTNMYTMSDGVAKKLRLSNYRKPVCLGGYVAD